MPAVRQPGTPAPSNDRLRLSRRQRLTHARQFQAVHDARMRRAVGPITASAIPNDHPFHRLGLAVSKRVGSSVKRNRAKRILREAFRTLQHNLATIDSTHADDDAAPIHLDIILSAKTSTLTLDEAKDALHDAIRHLARQWAKRLSKESMRDATRADSRDGPSP
ncbi:MAG: ribonuclease P protein component [Phycisphaerales bacterium]